MRKAVAQKKAKPPTATAIKTFSKLQMEPWFSEAWGEGADMRSVQGGKRR
jgi:hypothetical protein